ncbi:uncharacterized protein [Montipora capricornis]|uniref:uncharacterized protein n=1 Tax=Montipora capricornis TaxID=246305 RepID=UPI0035F20BA2
MTIRDQSREDVSGPNSSLATPKHTLRVGAWNVHTMFETGKTAQVFKEMERYRLNSLGLSEIRWTGSGKITLGTGATLCYSGRSDGQHHGGVGFAMDRQSAKALLEWEPVSARIVRARFHSKFVKTTVIQCYAPTDQAEEEDKDLFYQCLQAQLDRTPRHDLLLVIGDLNAKVGSDNSGYEECMGREGEGVESENGCLLKDLCRENGDSDVRQCVGKKQRKDWVSEGTWQKIEERKTTKQQLLAAAGQPADAVDETVEKYRTLDKEVKKSARQDKRRFVEDLCKEAQDAAARRDTRTVYKIAKVLTGSFTNRSSVVKNKQGNVLSKEEELMTRWAEHFQEVLNRDEPAETLDFDNAEPQQSIEMKEGKITVEEIASAIKQTKGNRAPGEDRVTADMLKADPHLSAQMLVKLFNQAWEGRRCLTIGRRASS